MSKELWDKLSELREREKLINEERKAIIANAVNTCQHELKNIRELPYEKRIFGCDPPWLICLGCGLTEEGWGCGYKKLSHAAYKELETISKDEWFKIRTMTVFQDGHVC